MICTYLFHFNPIGILVKSCVLEVKCRFVYLKHFWDVANQETKVFFVKSLMSINDYCSLARKIARRSGSGVCSLTSGANKNCQMTTINGFKEELQ